jgi:hypothetical protein
MNRRLLPLGGLLVALAALSAAAPPGKVRVEVRELKVAEATNHNVTLNVSWGYVEQDVRPKTVSIIAILIGAKGHESRATLNVPVAASGPLPTSARVVIPSDELGGGAVACRFSVTVTPGITDGTSNTVVSGKKDLSVTVVPRI